MHRTVSRLLLVTMVRFVHVLHVALRWSWDFRCSSFLLGTVYSSNFLDHADSDGFLHVSDCETAERWDLGERLDNEWFCGDHMDQSSVACNN